MIKIEGEHLRLYDLGSAHGAFVNGKRVREPVALEDGDMVRLGKQSYLGLTLPDALFLIVTSLLYYPRFCNADVTPLF